MFILLLIFNTKTQDKLNLTSKQFLDLRQELSKQAMLNDKRHKEILEKIAEQIVVQPKEVIITEQQFEPKQEVPLEIGKVEPIQESVKTEEKLVEPEKIIKPEEIQSTNQNQLINSQPLTVSEQKIQSPVQPKVIVKPIITKPPKKKSDIEKFVGEKLITFIAIGILVIGLSFFVKFAIDKDWISEIGRVAIGILCGGVLIGIAHRVRNQFRAFSSIVAGGGLATLYFTIAYAFHTYHLFSQTVAFVIMVVITIFAVLLSLSYDRKELAILALIGGLATPFMLATGEGNYKILFTYLIILNTGMLVLSYFKKWKLVYVISYFGTLLIYVSWLGVKVLSEYENQPYMGALVFGSIFYLIFFLMNIINNVKSGEKFNGFEIIMLLSNSFVYYTCGMLIINQMNPLYNGLFTAIMAVFNFVFAYVLYKRKQIDNLLIYSLIALVLTFLSLAAPVQLNGSYITLFWAAEAAALLWLSQKSGIKIIKIASAIVMVLMLVSLIMDWSEIYTMGLNIPILPIIINKGFITSMVAIGAMILYLVLLKNDNEFSLIKYLSIKTYHSILTVFVIVALYIAGLIELIYQLEARIINPDVRSVLIGMYNYIFILVILLWAKLKEAKIVSYVITSIGLLSVLVYLTVFHYSYILVRNAYLFDQILNSYYIFNLISACCVSIITYFSWRNTQQFFGEKSVAQALVLWFAVFVGLFVISSELDHWVLFGNYKEGFLINEIINSNQKVGYPIIWGVAGFVLMIIGMKTKNRNFRIISLTVFLVTIIKLFAWDIQGISEGGKIAAFISLGILLLVLGFMYQKLKLLLFDQDEKEKDDKEKENENETLKQ